MMRQHFIDIVKILILNFMLTSYFKWYIICIFYVFRLKDLLTIITISMIKRMIYFYFFKYIFIEILFYVLINAVMGHSHEICTMSLWHKNCISVKLHKILSKTICDTSVTDNLGHGMGHYDALQVTGYKFSSNDEKNPTCHIFPSNLEWSIVLGAILLVLSIG